MRYPPLQTSLDSAIVVPQAMVDAVSEANLGSFDEVHIRRMLTPALRWMEEQRKGECFLHELSAERLLQRAVINSRSRSVRSGERHPLWLGVAAMFALGSSYSRELCSKFGFNPDEEVTR